MTVAATTAWFVARKGNLFILAERSMKDKVFSMNLKTNEFSIITKHKVVVMGELLKVDMSPEALLDSIDIREGDKILLLPQGSGDAE